MHLYQAYLKAAGLPPMDHRNRRVSGSHTFAASNRPPQRRQASVFSRAVAFVKAWAERRRGTRELYALNDRLLADIGLTRMDISAAQWHLRAAAGISSDRKPHSAPGLRYRQPWKG